MSLNDILTIIILSLLIVFIAIVEIKRKKRIDFLLIFNLSYATFFAIVPIIIMIWPDLLVYNTPVNWAYHFETFKGHMLMASIYAFIFYLIFIISYKLINKKRFVKEQTQMKASHVDQNTVFWAGIAFLIIGIVSFFLYSTSVGGPVSAIINAQAKRSGVIEATGALSFFKHFIISVYFGMFVFFTAKPEKAIFRKLRMPLLIIAIFFSIVVLFVYSGRANIIILSFTALFYNNIIKNKVYLGKWDILKYIVFILILGFVSAYYRPFMQTIAGADIQIEPDPIATPSPLENALQSGNPIVGMFASIVKAFSVPMISLLVAIENTTFGNMRMFTGFLQVFLDIIPKSIIDYDGVHTINRLNTELFGYVVDSGQYNINAGLLAYFYYEFHWIGIVLGGAITAAIIKLSDDFLNYLKNNRTIAVIMVFFLANLPNRILAGDQVGGIKRFLILYLEFLIILFLVKFMKPKINENMDQLDEKDFKRQ